MNNRNTYDQNHMAKDPDRSLRQHCRSKAVLRILAAFLLAAAGVFFITGCGSGEKADIEYIDNGYGTIFVTGKKIANACDTSTSTVVDWRDEETAVASDELSMKEIKGIVYRTAELTDGKNKGDTTDLNMNLKYDPSKGRQPVVIFVPGGGFISCQIDGKYENIHKYLVEKGYAVAIVEYRIIGQGMYKDAAEDIRGAIDWVKTEGVKYGLDKDDIYLMGNSGGGYVAALAACMDPSDIRCVVNYYGLCDIANNKADYEEAAIEAHHTPQSSDSQFVYGVYSGKALGEDPEGDEEADPISYIDGDEPPFIHFHGDEDLLVSPSQSLHLHNALMEKGITSVRYFMKGEGHGSRGFRTKKSLDTAIGFMNQYRNSPGREE